MVCHFHPKIFNGEIVHLRWVVFQSYDKDFNVARGNFRLLYYSQMPSRYSFFTSYIISFNLKVSTGIWCITLNPIWLGFNWSPIWNQTVKQSTSVFELPGKLLLLECFTHLCVDYCSSGWNLEYRDFYYPHISRWSLQSDVNLWLFPRQLYKRQMVVPLLCKHKFPR